MKKKSLKSQLLLQIMLSLILSVLIVSAINITTLSKNTMENSSTILQTRSETEAATINGWADGILKTTEVNANTFGVLLQNYDGDPYALSGMLSENAKAINVFDIYVGLPNGECIFGSGWMPDYASGWAAYKRPWYVQALKSPNQVITTPPYIDSQTGEVCYTFAKALKNANGEIIGVYAVDALLENVSEVINAAATFSTNGEAFITDENGGILVHSNSDYNPDKDCNLTSFLALGERTYASATVPATGWKLYVSLPNTEITAPLRNNIISSLAVFLICIFIGAFVNFTTINKKAIIPIREIEEAADALAKGSTNLEIHDYSSHELSKLGKAFLSITDSTRAQTVIIEKIAEGDYSHELPPRSEYDTLALSINKMTESVRDVLSEIKTMTFNLDTRSLQMADGSRAVANDSLAQTEATDRLNDTLSEFTALIKLSSEAANLAQQQTVEAVDAISQTSDDMAQMTKAMNEIREQSSQISKIISIIDDIAFQTNILALNASVEAARAGVHGKGFAVVAEEVRNLANKSAGAAKSITALIDKSDHKIEEGGQIAVRAAAEFTKIASKITEASEVISSVSEKSQSQLSSADTFARGLSQISDVVSRNSAFAEESSANAAEISSMAARLKGDVERFIV